MQIIRRIAAAITVFAASLVLAPLAAGATTTPPVTPANSPGPLLWTAPDPTDANPIDGIACPATTLCVAVDRDGYVLWSANPTGGPTAWHSADVDNSNELTSISCPTTTMCVAVDGSGNVITSPNPAAGGSSWTVTRVDKSPTAGNTDNGGAVLLRGVSCPSATVCVAVDAAGNVLASASPTAGASAWTITHVDTDPSYGCTGAGLTCQPPLVGVSCPSTTLCAAVDFSGNLLTTTNPTAQLPWTSTPTAGGALSSLYGISCPDIAFCIMVDGEASRAISVNPSTPAAQTSRSLPYSLNGVWCQSASLCLATVQTPDGISGLLGSFDPTVPDSSWSLSSLGGVNALACITASLCVAADDEGSIISGLTTAGAISGLEAELLPTRHLPTIADLDRSPSDTFEFTTPIAARVTLVWAYARANRTPIVVASTSALFKTAGTAKLTLRLSPAGRRLFKAATTKPIGLTATATFAASTGAVSAVAHLTFRHPPKPKPKPKPKAKPKPKPKPKPKTKRS